MKTLSLVDLDNLQVHKKMSLNYLLLRVLVQVVSLVLRMKIDFNINNFNLG
ncbi:hypothetical protein [Lactobacillus agrestimuris]|uniref:hypothetical protein n=1 Tax=Lactobacillus agrestimuris TaxID=2941328 RepID=UPI0020432D26|nr:hypothetical protein [Lactobacillus agrestimuris]